MAPKQPQRLRVITLASTKGGTGKTTLSSALAVRAAEESKRVALLDLDPQESLASWWTRRGRTKNPKLFEADATTEAIELLISEGVPDIVVALVANIGDRDRVNLRKALHCGLTP
jgi:chromosome partitioning protein